MADHTPSRRDGQDIAAPASIRQAALNARQPGGLTGRRLGDYHLRELLGAGGMADVYRAYDLVLMRDVAVKVLSDSLAEDADYVSRFRTEARRIAALRHPHLVPVYHAGEEILDGRRLLYLVMPLMRESLDDVLKRESRLSYVEAVRLILQVADGLDAAHRFGLIHRDVKPGNILIDDDGQVVLADFGLAREVSYASREATQQPWGTPEYMAPEQLRGGTIDQRIDIYSMGVVFYELLTGKRPFDGETIYDIAAHVLHDPLVPPSTYQPAIPRALERVVVISLAREPDDRYSSGTEFALALRRALGQQSGKNVGFASAVTVALPERFWTSPLRERFWTSPRLVMRASHRRSLRWVLGFLLVAGVLIASLSGVAMALHNGGQTSRNVSGAPGNGSREQASASAAGGLLPGQTPVTITPGTTDTPRLPVAATATAGPTSTLTIAPAPLVLKPDPANAKTCIATQTVTNNTNSTVGWSWQKPQVSGFHFQIDGKPSVGWPSIITNTPPGGYDTLVVTADCKPDPISYAVLVKDSLGGQYTFIMTLQ